MPPVRPEGEMYARGRFAFVGPCACEAPLGWAPEDEEEDEDEEAPAAVCGARAPARVRVAELSAALLEWGRCALVGP